jgi:hypothetical protein
MPHRTRKLRIGALAAASAASLALAGCGGGSGNAVQLLKQTFCGTHHVNSGNLNVALTVDPSGSRTLRGPISLSLSGPFQSLGSGRLPKSDLTVGLSALGNSLSVGIISTGSHGYITLSGSSYQLPQASYQKLESSFSAFASPPGCNSHSGVLGQLHIQPLHWLTNPQVAGTANVAGASTTHIHAGINVSALLGDLGTFLRRAPSLGLSGSSGGLSSSTLQTIASEIQNPSFDVWTGTGDRTLRKMSIHLTLPVTGQFSTLLGGLTSAGIGLTMQYGDLNQPQTINAPTSLQPYSQLKTKLAALFAAIRSQLTGILAGGLSGTGTSSSSGSGTSTGTSSSGKLQAYSRCIQAAGGDVSKMQKCAPLLSKSRK